jgi:uncharacterized protein with HEPN domain
MTDHLERSPKLYLSEVIAYIEKIESFTKDLTEEQFLGDEMRVYAVDALIRNIGEAVRVLAKHREIKALFYSYRIPYDDLSDLRTEFTHEYFSVDKKLLWETANSVLPRLKPQFKKVLDAVNRR